MSNMVSIKIIGIGGGARNSIERLKEIPMENTRLCVIDNDYEVLKSDIKDKVCVQDFSDIIPFGSSESWFNRFYATPINENKVWSMISSATKHVILVAGFGGSMGTFGTKWLVKLLKNMNIPTTVVCSIPFDFEEEPKRQLASETIKALSKENVSMVIIKADDIIGRYSKLQFNNCFMYLDEYVSSTVTDICRAL